MMSDGCFISNRHSHSLELERLQCSTTPIVRPEIKALTVAMLTSCNGIAGSTNRDFSVGVFGEFVKASCRDGFSGEWMLGRKRAAGGVVAWLIGEPGTRTARGGSVTFLNNQNMNKKKGF